MDGQVQNLQVKLCSAKKQFVIAPSVFDSPAPQHRLNPLPVASPQDLGATKRVLYRLPQEVRKCDTEKFVAQHVGRSHRSPRYWINKSRSIDKLGLARRDNIDKIGSSSGMVVKSASRIIKTSPVAASKPVQTFRDLAKPGPCSRRISLSG